MLIAALWIVCGGIAASMIANKRGKDSGLWFVIGALLGPFGILFAALSDGRRCPYCREHVHPQAVKCPKCQSAIQAAGKTPQVVRAAPVKHPKLLWGIVLVIPILAIIEWVSIVMFLR